MGDKPETWRMQEVREWEKGSRKIDLTEEFKKNNQQLLKGYGRDRYTYKVELTDAAHQYYSAHEARNAHGYPMTAWLQLGLLYATGLYTAKQQGCVARGVIFSRFWRFHYFDWLTFMRRGAIYAWAGGLVAGTVLFGSPEISVRRIAGFYNLWIKEDIQDNRGDNASYLVGKF